MPDAQPIVGDYFKTGHIVYNDGVTRAVYKKLHSQTAMFYVSDGYWVGWVIASDMMLNDTTWVYAWSSTSPDFQMTALGTYCQWRRPPHSTAMTCL